jgi:hypothetical protein
MMNTNKIQIYSINLSFSHITLSIVLKTTLLVFYYSHKHLHLTHHCQITTIPFYETNNLCPLVHLLGFFSINSKQVYFIFTFNQCTLHTDIWKSLSRNHRYQTNTKILLTKI